MTEPTQSRAEKIILELSGLFNSRVDLGYIRDRNEWYVSLKDAYKCFESESTVRYEDGTTEKILAATYLSRSGKTLEEAATKLERATVGSGRGFLVSNREFGGFGSGWDDDDGEHLIDVFEGRNKIETFPYDKEKTRALLHKYAPGG